MADELQLDPFGLVPEWRSKIIGLGGGGDPQDLNYVLHTVYVPVAEGHANFRVRFAGLQGKLGTLVLRVHMYQKGSKDARLVTSERLLLSRLVQLGGNYDVRFEAFHGVIYALYASLEGMSDAAANQVEVVLDRPGDEDAPPATATEARNSSFGRGTVRASASIISVERATLASPVSQRCTPAQLAGPVFRDWSQRLGGEPAAPLDRWVSVYVLQVLRAYGMLALGAAGLGIGAAASGVAALAAASGPTVQVVDADKDEPLALSRLLASAGHAQDVCERIAYRTIDLASPPRDLVNFDFLWSERVISRLGSAADGIRLADRMMAHLRPGGLAVHVVDFTTGAEAAAPSGGIVPWQRRELDRLALILISRGHEIAEIKVDGDSSRRRAVDDASTRNGITAAGLIVRKAQTIE